MPLSLRYAAHSDIGLVRTGNEDSGYAGPRLLVVADGMGGAAAGEVASSIVVSSLAALDDDDLGGDLLDALAASVARAESLLTSSINADQELDGMGTTLTALLWSGSRVGLVHVGDSRAYLLRGGDLLRLTHDHTYVQTLVDKGEISAEEAESHPRRSLLMQALDGRNPSQPDLSVREVRAGDRFMVCSDGLSGVVSEATMAEELATGEPSDAAQRLIALAKRAGGPDNITVVIADAVASEARPNTQPVVVGAAGEPELAERAATIVDSTPAAKARQQLGGADTDRARALERSEATQGYERQARQTRWIRRGLIAAGVLVLFILAGVFTSQWISKQYFVANEANTVAIYRGVNQQVAWLKLSTAVELSGISTPSLPELTQGQVLAGIAATDLSDARAIVERLRGEAASCAVATPPAGCPTSQPIPAPTLTPRFVTPTPSNTITG
ncbi:MAG: hypothetical protein GM44_3875 [actinobacterium acAMD-2]|jgi:protein phosphatase|nr:MAG: hypothetical protein GM44_3875 [actinobacterium acAMD-2]HAS07754.1 protein phosphatase [Actinomycetota bacterium]